MWDISQAKIENGYRCNLTNNGARVSYYETLESLASDESFRSFFVSFLKKLPFKSYRWETPAFSSELIDRKFEFVVLNAPSLDRPADSRPFDLHIRTAQEDAVSFDNLGGDAHIVVPSARDNRANYCHLGSFTRTAPMSQQLELWKVVGESGVKRVTNKPIWLSTAGGGVAWLHIRFDSHPKYYHFGEFRKLG